MFFSGITIATFSSFFNLGSMTSGVFLFRSERSGCFFSWIFKGLLFWLFTTSFGFSPSNSLSLIKIFWFLFGFGATCGIICSCLLEIIIVVGLSFSGFSVFLINFSGIIIGAFWILGACFYFA
ncbi:hypothetical protein DR099_02635 [Mycoplasma hyopneumoniae]|nr:hypothetical protein [Mesomycoplasma hyopneumoniae]